MLKEYAEFIRAITRPFCLIFMVICISLMVYDGKEVPGWFWGTFAPFFIWWSTDRSIKHIKDSKK